MFRTITQLKQLYHFCVRIDANLFYLIFRVIVNRYLHKINLWSHHGVQIKGIQNINTNGRKLNIGLLNLGFASRFDRTYINIEGKLSISGDYSIGRGCRIFVGKNGTIAIGKGGYINGFTKLIIMHELTIGDNCAISWDCQILDEDFHHLTYEGRSERSNSIKIGNHVWIGCGVKIYKGSVIPDHCVVAADSVVRGVFTQTNTLIAGNPAKVVKEGVAWA